MSKGQRRRTNSGKGTKKSKRPRPRAKGASKSVPVPAPAPAGTRLRQDERLTRRLAAVVTDSNDAVILFDPAGHIQAWNRGAQAMYGWNESEALRMNLRDLTPPEGAAGMGDMVRRLLAGETVTSFETRRRTKDGRVLEAWLTVTARGRLAGEAWL